MVASLYNPLFIGAKIMDRVIILGNLGSGKTYLSQRMAGCLALDMIHLDDLFWEPGRFDPKRLNAELDLEIADFAQGQFWVVEGVVGELAHEFFQYADTLIWLDMDWATCMASLRARHPETSRGSGEDQREENFRELLKWASEYWQRFDTRSYKGHQYLFSQFKGRKIRLASRRAIENFLETIPQVTLYG
jgi:adenylate kinase family enzyme